jgi:hypothetical protein
VRGLPSTALLTAAGFVALLGLVGSGVTLGAFRGTTSDSGNSFSAATDWAAPTVSASVISKSPGYSSGFVKQGGTYYLYANVSDAGNPASGVSTINANVSSITTGATSVALTAGSYTVEGVSYGYRSASRVASNPLAAGSKTYSITSTDAAGNSRTQSTFSVTVDNTAPAASDVQAANGGSIVGRPEQNDTITYTFAEPIDPESILTGWTGSATNVVVRVNNASPDTVTIFNAANTTQLPPGTIDLGRNDYVGANRTFGATGTASSMVRSGSTITITLGTQSGAGTTAGANGTMTWTPSTATYDRAGNAGTATAATESGTADKEF